ncbi:hypothetical protein DH2020_016853 [Rehmannia glutinosa]|uniref:Uncharacterized protein n=1 Tax=Rehmannia glutinosa TaxID=99300 RepID=A0ABR0WR00_REHGL
MGVKGGKKKGASRDRLFEAMEDKIMEIASPRNFYRKNQGRAKACALDDYTISHEKNKITVTADAAFSKDQAGDCFQQRMECIRMRVTSISSKRERKKTKYPDWSHVPLLLCPTL